MAAAQPGLAHFPGIFGRDFQRWEQGAPALPPGPVSAIQPGGSPANPEQLAVSRALLEALEHRDGPYGDGLYEPLTLLGRLHRDSGDYERAARLYERALHVMRVNDGLRGPGQVPLLHELMELYRREGQMEKLDQVHDYYFRILGSGQPPLTGAGKTAALSYIDWQREARQLGIDSDNNARLLKLYATNQSLLDSALADPLLDQAWHRELVFSQLHNLYLVFGELPVEEQVVGRSTAGETVPGQVRSPEFVRQRMTNLQQTGVAKGRDLLTGYLQRWPGMAPLERAQVSLELADWYQWNERYKSAEAGYLGVISLLRESDADHLLSEWFSTAAELPASGMFRPTLEHADESGPIVVSASFSVSPRGRVSAVEISTTDPRLRPRAMSLKGMLRDTHFRPRFLVSGERAAATVSRDYLLFR
jgi:tetratricopeptide (TPR) repeat protein